MFQSHRRAGLRTLCALVFTLALAAPAQAQPFAVTKDADTNDGTCDSDCSLREAVIAANANPGADTITIPAGLYALTLQGPGEDSSLTGDLDIEDDVTITGAGARSTTVNGNSASPTASSDRVFDVLAGTHATLTGMTISFGAGYGDVGGGIANAGDLTLTGVTVTRNKATSNGGTGGDGGGIYNDGTLHVTDSTLSKNTASGNGGGMISYGDVTAANATIDGNSALGDGGGSDLESGTVTVTNATVTRNGAGSAGLSLAGAGGGVYNSAALTVTNTIVSGNTGTVSDNGTFTSVADNCAGTVAPNSGGHNLDSGDNCVLMGEGDHPNTDPQVGPLDANGGQTDTAAIQPTSPALDKGLASACPAADQRGIARPQGNGCDIGAFELEVVDVAVTVTANPVDARSGDTLTFSGTATNVGSQPALRVKLKSSLSGNLGGASTYTWSDSSCSSSTCTVDSLAPGATLSFVLTVTAGNPPLGSGGVGSATDTVTVTPESSFEERTDNNTASVAVRLTQPPPVLPPPRVTIHITTSGPAVQHLRKHVVFVNVSCDVACTPNARGLWFAGKKRFSGGAVQGKEMPAKASVRLVLKITKKMAKRIATALKHRQKVRIRILIGATAPNGSGRAIKTVKVVR